MAMARPMPTRRSLPKGSVPATRAPTAPRPSHSRMSRARFRAASRSSPTATAPASMFSMHAQALEQQHALEGAGEAGAAALEGGPERDVGAGEPHAALGRRLESRQHIDQGRLARAIGPDQPEDLARRQGQAHLLDGAQPLEVDGDALDVERRAHVFLPDSDPHPGNGVPSRLRERMRWGVAACSLFAAQERRYCGTSCARKTPMEVPDLPSFTSITIMSRW